MSRSRGLTRADAARNVAARRRVPSPPPPLTERELEVILLAAEGCGYTEIAGRLHMSRATVKNHLVTIRAKLEARNTTHAVAIVVGRNAEQ